MFFDWASQPYFTLLLTFVFAPYFSSAVVEDAARGQVLWGWMLAATGILTAVCAPVIGAIADGSGPRRHWIMAFSAMYVVGAFSVWWALPGSGNVFMILTFFGIGIIGLEFATIFTNAMLPDLCTRREVGLISGFGWAFGYVGGLVSLAFVVLYLAENASGTTLIGAAPIFGLDAASREGTRFVGPFTAAWFIVFIIPFFLWVRDPPVSGRRGEGLAGLFRTIRNLPRNRSLLAYLASSMLYRDALNGVFAFGGIYAAGVLEWSVVQIGIFGIFALVSGMVCTWLGGYADRRLGPKPVIASCIIALSLVCAAIIGISRDSVFGFPVGSGSNLPDILFFVCGGIIGGAGGVIQSASRTMVVRQADHTRMTEAFGLYALAGRATAFLAPSLIAVATDMSGDQRLGISPIVVLFLGGLLMLKWVNPEGGYEHENE